MSATKPTGRIQTPHFSPTSSREIQSPASSNRVQTPHIHPTSSSSFQTPQMPPKEPSNNRRLTTIPKEASKECGYQKGPKEVMVLKATESFTYEFKECEKRMFHATVATESQFFRVKVFDISLKDKFIPRKVIAISDYIGRNGFLEIYSASSVSDVSANRKMEISYRLVQIANGTPKIEYLCSQCTVKYMSVNYLLQKNVREDCTYYEIQDNTGRMEVVVYGRLTYINCEEGDKLKLFCFELAFNADKWQLRSVFHSYIKVGILWESSKECGYQKGPKEVMVLKATESFTYEFKECEKRMFHATVATESQFFRVKVFDISLKDKFIPRKVIAISDYIGRNGFLEIYSASSVSDVSANRKMEISYRLVQIANGTPKIEYLCSQCTVKYVNGVYTVYKVSHNCTYYEIQDNTGKMEVVVHGRLIYINCEEGDKLKLFCFELAFNEDKWQLRSVKHSYIKVGILRECLSSKGVINRGHNRPKLPMMS
uniref:HIN-200 domain-containing protein n=1 Tax=Sciurus vulgaris TaxID=55149 RepID=A0A8D2B1L7_SCIVU